MSPGAIFERVYLALKEQIVSGAFPPGEQLEPAALSADLVASITPVRDALHRLVGERLVHAPRGDGFRMPIYTEAALRDLYGWNQRLLRLALGPGAAAAARERPQDVALSDPHETVVATARLFEEIARLAGSSELLATVSSLNDRLGAVRRKEASLLEPGPELDAMMAALASSEPVLLRRLVSAYHRRRIARVPLLLEQLQPRL
jgi:DNA-binding GntR family transcriptional regulator